MLKLCTANRLKKSDPRALCFFCAILLLPAFLFFASCASYEGPPEVVIDYSSARSVRYEMQQIASLYLTDSVQALLRARNLRSSVNENRENPKAEYGEELLGEVDDLYADSLEIVRSSFDVAVSESDWLDAIRFYRSLAALGEAPPEWSFESLLRSQITDWEKEGNTTLSSLFTVTHSTPEDEAPNANIIADMISATVTVWVDRGLSIQGGVGYASRVIGSGFFIDERGYIITNYHVISSEVAPDYEGYSRLYIKLADDPDGRIPARVVGWDPIFDLALLKTEVTPPAVFELGSSRDLRVGTRIYAIGSPGGLEQTITSGIVSAQGRRFLSLGDVLQIDAPINQGNSGGPIIDEAGRVQAVVFAGVESFEGLNFAIPVELLKLILPQLYSGGLTAHAWLGGYGRTFSSPADAEGAGISVIYCIPGLSLSQAGIPEDAVITAVNGQRVSTLEQLQYALMLEYPGTIVRLSGYTIKETIDADDPAASIRAERVPGDWYAVLYARPEKPGALVIERDLQSRVFLPIFGMNLQRIGSKKQYTVASVVRGGIADESGFSRNDVVEIRAFVPDTKNGTLLTQVAAKRRKSGYVQTFIALGASLDSPYYF